MSKKRIFMVMAILTLATVVGATIMFWKSKPKDTVIDEHVFSLTVPGQWNRQPSSDPTRWTYGNENGHEQLTVSVLKTTSQISAEEQLKTLKNVTDVRRRAETNTPGVSGVTLTDTTFADLENVATARYSGFESEAQRHFSCLLLCNASAVTVVYYEALDMTDQESDSRAVMILNSVRVPK